MYRPQTESDVGAADAGSPATGAIRGAVMGAAPGEQLHRGADESSQDARTSTTVARLELDARVRAHDGENAGQVLVCELTPDLRTVTRIVMKTGHLDGHDAVVPLNAIEEIDDRGNWLRLSLDGRALEAQPVLPPAPAAGAYPEAPVRLAKATLVQDVGGENLGELDAVRFDVGSGRLYSLVVRCGNPANRLLGRGETVEVSAGMVETLTASAVFPSAKAIQLTVTTEALRAA